METDVVFFLIEDSFGNKVIETSKEFSDIVQVSGVSNELGENPVFEDNGQHLLGWCKEHGFKYLCHKKTFTFEQIGFDEIYERANNQPNDHPRTKNQD